MINLARSRGNTITFMPECGFDIDFGKGRILLLYLLHRISLLGKFLYGLYSNPCASYDPGVMTDISRPYYSAFDISFAFSHSFDVPLGIGNDDSKRDSDHILLIDNFSILRRLRFDKYDTTIQHKKFRRSPLFFRHLRKFFGGFAKMLQGNPILIAEDIEHAQGNDVRKGIDPAECDPPVLFRKRRGEETGSVPVSKLSLRDSGKPLHLVFAKGRNDHWNRRTWGPPLLNHMSVESRKSKRAEGFSPVPKRPGWPP